MKIKNIYEKVILFCELQQCRKVQVILLTYIEKIQRWKSSDSIKNQNKYSLTVRV